MFYEISLYAALAIFGLGVVYRISTWFRYSVGARAREIPTSTRVFAAAKGIVLTLFSTKVLTLLRVLALDVFLQVRILREDFLRWFMHMCIYTGFTLLLLMHALDKLITASLFEDYYSTLNPFLFLRDLSGGLVILGLAIAVCRRFIMKTRRVVTSAMDHYVTAILAIVIICGFLLEATKIVSYSGYQQMVEEYAGLGNEQELTS